MGYAPMKSALKLGGITIKYIMTSIDDTYPIKSGQKGGPRLHGGWGGPLKATYAHKQKRSQKHTKDTRDTRANIRWAKFVLHYSINYSGD